MSKKETFTREEVNVVLAQLFNHMLRGTLNREKRFGSIPNEVCLGQSIVVVPSFASHLMGKVLTVIDASIVDEKQNKALKDVIKVMFREKQDEFTYSLLREVKGIVDSNHYSFMMENLSESLELDTPESL